MSTITASLVKELRDATGAGMMACKRALQETGGDLEAARTLLRERGMAPAAKRAGRATTEGSSATASRAPAARWSRSAARRSPSRRTTSSRRSAARCSRPSRSAGRTPVADLEDERVELTAKLGENIVVTGAERYEAGEGEVLGAYAHPPANKIGVLVKLAGGTTELARQLAMHISFAAPEWTTKEDVPAELVEAEQQIYLNSDELAGQAGAGEGEDRRGHAREAVLRRAARWRRSRSSPGSTTRRRRSGRRSRRPARMSSPSSASLSQNRHVTVQTEEVAERAPAGAAPPSAASC